MNVNDIASSLGAASLASTLGQSERARSRPELNTSPATQALDQASQRLQDQQSSTQVRLSAFGQIQSAVEKLQESGRPMRDNESTNTPEEARAVVKNFVDAYNNARDVASRVTGEEGALADDNRAQVAASELSRTLNSTSRNELRAIGVNTNSNGTLSIDTQRFERALQENNQEVGRTLANVGQQLEETSTRTVENTVNRSVESLEAQNRALEVQQTQQRELADNLQQATEQAAAQFNFVAASGIRTYEQIFSL
jgi:flagellar capping protein FliD